MICLLLSLFFKIFLQEDKGSGPFVDYVVPTFLALDKMFVEQNMHLDVTLYYDLPNTTENNCHLLVTTSQAVLPTEQVNILTFFLVNPLSVLELSLIDVFSEIKCNDNKHKFLVAQKRPD